MQRTIVLVAVSCLLGVLACGPATTFEDDGGTSMDGGDTPDAGPTIDALVVNDYVCSNDLHSVLDDQGNIVETCPADQGCLDGRCVEACMAASGTGGNVGCNFVLPTPNFYVGYQPPCFAAFVANNWTLPARITASYDGVSHDVTQFGRIAQAGVPEASWPAVPVAGVPAGEVAVLFLSQSSAPPFACPITPAIATGSGTAVIGTGRGKAWRIDADAPVSLYDILPYGGANSYLPSAELVMPISAWGTNYVAVLPMASNSGSGGPPWGQIVASEANTTVNIVPSVSLPAGTDVVPAAMGLTTTYVLDAEQTIQWQLAGDMSGSFIQSDKPIAFVGGDAYICYQSATSTGGGCDSAHQMIPPLSALGQRYVAPPYTTRGTNPESIWYRIVGVADGTLLTYDPPVAGAPAALAQGDVVDFQTTLAFVVSSQDEDHPFYVGQSMTGLFVAGNNSNDGDEEFVNILPPAQFLSRYVFFTDPSYPTTNLVFVRTATATGFHDVDLDCTGVIGGWVDVGTDGTYQMTNVDLIRLGTPNGSCTNGPHTAESTGPFGIMVWGLAYASSYAYPAGGNVEAINPVVIIVD